MNYQNFQTQILKIVVNHLRGNYSDSLTRFSYINGGARIFLRLINDPDYLGYNREIILINKIALKINRDISPNQLIDFGPGDGTKAVSIIKSINSSNTQYLGLDISREMLNIARQTFVKNNTSGSFKTFDWHDLTNLRRIIRDDNNQSNLILLLGNTLTNEVDIRSFLINLRETISSFASINFLLIGLELFGCNLSQIIKEYRNEINFTLTIRPLEMIGISKNDGVIDISFNRELERIEELFIFKRRRVIRLNNFDVMLNNKSRILLSVTYKPTIEEVRRLFRESGWNILFSDFVENQAMFLLRPKPR